MKRITLVRHAHAEEKAPGGTDFDRPLSPRGLREASALAKSLLRAELVPDLLVTSPARRTRQTTDILVQTLNVPPQRVQSSPELYLASPETLLGFARTVDPGVQHLALVGHNPGLSDAIRVLLPSNATAPDLSTGRACVLTIDIESWTDGISTAKGFVCYPF
jgi:phosphohistidine phosphatase